MKVLHIIIQVLVRCCFSPLLQYYTSGPLNVCQSSGNKVP